MPKGIDFATENQSRDAQLEFKLLTPRKDLQPTWNIPAAGTPAITQTEQRRKVSCSIVAAKTVGSHNVGHVVVIPEIMTAHTAPRAPGLTADVQCVLVEHLSTVQYHRTARAKRSVSCIVGAAKTQCASHLDSTHVARIRPEIVSAREPNRDLERFSQSRCT